MFSNKKYILWNCPMLLQPYNLTDCHVQQHYSIDNIMES